MIDNALKFSDYGAVVVEVESIKKMIEQIQLKFSVHDSGIGLSPEQVDSLFQSFSQIDGSCTRKFGGMGLGLSVCKRLVQLMGGEMSVASTLGKGSTFSFSLKLKVDDIISKAPGSGASHARGITGENGDKWKEGPECLCTKLNRLFQTITQLSCLNQSLGLNYI